MGGSRRDLLRSVARGLVSAGLAALGWAALRGGHRASGAGHACTGNGVCRSCRESSSCVMPQAASYRKAAGQP